MGIPLLNHFRDAVDWTLGQAGEVVADLKEVFKPAVENSSPTVSDGFFAFSFLPENPWKKLAQLDDVKTIPETLVNQEATGYEYSAEVEMAQLNLEKLGFGDHLGKPGADGYFGPLTQTAVMAYEESIGVEPTGSITPELFERMQTDILALEKDGVKPATEKDLSNYEQPLIAVAQDAKSFVVGSFDKVASILRTEDNRPVHERVVEGKVRLTSQFGEDRGTHDHGGIDLAGESPGDKPDILAAADGVVLKSYTSTTYGNIVEIQHASPTQGKVSSLYAHLDKPSDLEVGDTVKAGSVIGVMGETGRSQGVHLHFEAKLNGNQFNPADFDKALKGEKINLNNEHDHNHTPTQSQTFIPA